MELGRFVRARDGVDAFDENRTPRLIFYRSLPRIIYRWHRRPCFSICAVSFRRQRIWSCISWIFHCGGNFSGVHTVGAIRFNRSQLNPFFKVHHYPILHGCCIRQREIVRLRGSLHTRPACRVRCGLDDRISDDGCGDAATWAAERNSDAPSRHSV